MAPLASLRWRHHRCWCLCWAALAWLPSADANKNGAMLGMVAKFEEELTVRPPASPHPPPLGQTPDPGSFAVQTWQLPNGRERGRGELPPIARGPRRFLLYRLIGNDVPPLQCQGQLYLNTLYTLEYETRELPECRKIWVLNHIISPGENARITSLLSRFGYPPEDILVRRIEFAKVASAEVEQWLVKVTAQNEARNFMIEHGVAQAGAEWILPFDGNQFVTDEAWENIRRAAARNAREGLKYFKVPMFRIIQEQHPKWLSSGAAFDSLERFIPALAESQIAFHIQASERFNQTLEYGHNNKLEFIERVCGFLNEDTKQCGCQREVGPERRLRGYDEGVASTCGYSLRLWWYPCANVSICKIFHDVNYRTFLRNKEGRPFLRRQLEEQMKEWAIRVECQVQYKQRGTARPEDAVIVGAKEMVKRKLNLTFDPAQVAAACKGSDG